MAIFLAAIVALWRQPSSERRNEMVLLCAIALLAAYILQNQTGFDSVVSLFSWFVLLAFIQFTTTAASHDERLTPVTHTRRRTQSILAALALPAGLWFFVLQPLIGFLSLSASVQASTIDDHLTSYDRAVNLSRAGIHYRRSYMAYETTSTLWYLAGVNQSPYPNAIRAELELAKSALQDTLAHTPNYLRASLMLARVYQVESHLFRPLALEEAQAVLKEAIASNPHNPLPLWAMASVLIQQGNAREALEQAQMAFELNPDNPKAHTNRLLAAVFLKDQTLLSSLMQESLERFPNATQDFQMVASLDTASTNLAALDLFYSF